MSDWTEVELGDVLTLQRGFDLPSRARIDGPVPIVSSSGVTGSHNESKVNPPGIVIGRYGSLGQVHWIETPFWPLNTSLWVKDFKGNDPRFLSYLLRTLTFDGSTASAVPGVNRNHLHTLAVRRPPVSAQRRIAAVLSAFDKLIEINERRIELLEDLARSLYREWFVRFRFPGHEDVTLVDSELGSIPDGWVISPLSEVVSRLRVRKTYTPSTVQAAGSVPVIDQSDRGLLGFHDGAPSLVAAPSDPVIVFGDHTCRTEVMIEPFSLGPNVIAFKPAGRFPTLALVQFIQGQVEQTEYKRHWNDLMSKKVIHPSNEMLEVYSQAVSPMYELRRSLAALQRNVTRARDLLLPRLVSGRLDISDIDLGPHLSAEPT